MSTPSAWPPSEIDHIDLELPGPPRWGWVVLLHPGRLEEGTLERHILPTMDVNAHAFDLGCACHPFEDRDGDVIHAAFDRREDYEQGRRKVN